MFHTFPIGLVTSTSTTTTKRQCRGNKNAELGKQSHGINNNDANTVATATTKQHHGNKNNHATITEMKLAWGREQKQRFICAAGRTKTRP